MIFFMIKFTIHTNLSLLNLVHYILSLEIIFYLKNLLKILFQYLSSQSPQVFEEDTRMSADLSQIQMPLQSEPATPIR